MLRILLLASPNSSHTLKIANSLADSGISVFVFGFGDRSLTNIYDKRVTVKTIEVKESIVNGSSTILKLYYLLYYPLLKKTIKEFKPDILHANYATSYGFLGMLTSFTPFIVSVWGTDVFEFPKKNPFFKYILKRIFNSADKLISTSYIMANEIKKYTQKTISVIPFGIDTEKFKPVEKEKSDIVKIGVIKSLERFYGIEYLIHAVKILLDKGITNIRLFIIGKGSLETELKELSKELGLNDYILFTGAKQYSEIENYHNMLDIGVYVSVAESFGVSQLESLSCGVPVIASNVGGIPEVVIDGETGFLVPPKNPEKTADAIIKLVLNRNLRDEMGKKGREFVIAKYSWNDCIDKLISEYKSLMSSELY